MCCTSANGRVYTEEQFASKTQLHGLEGNLSRNVNYLCSKCNEGFNQDSRLSVDVGAANDFGSLQRLVILLQQKTNKNYFKNIIIEFG